MITKHWFTWLALHELWARRGRSLLSLLALALSVGLLLATGSIAALMRSSVATPAPILGRPSADFLWISSAYDVDYDLPAGLSARVEVVPGVAEVQPLLRRPVQVRTPRPDNLTLMGVEPTSYFALHNLTLAAGQLPTTESPGLVALAPWAFIRDLRLGQPIIVSTPSGDVPMPLVGLIEVKNLAAARQGVVLYAPLETVADMFGLHDAVTALEVYVRLGASIRQVRADLEQTLGPAYAVSTAAQSGPGSQLWQRLVLGALAVVDGLTLAGSTALVYAVFASAARARRRQIGLLRVVGAVKRQVLALLLTEAILLGLAGSGLGLIIGFLFAQAGAGLVLPGAAPGSTTGTLGPDPVLAGLFGGGAGISTTPPLPAGSVFLAVGLGLLASLAGAIGPALRAARQPPLEALRTDPYPPHFPGSRRFWGNLSHRISSPLLERVQTREWMLEARLAASNLSREPGRASLIVGTLALILAMALGNVGVLSLLGEELAATFGRLTDGDYLVLPGLTTISLRELAGQDTSDVPPLNPDLLSALEDLEDQVWLMKGTTANIETLQVFPGQPTLLLDIEGYAQMGGFSFQSGDWPSALEAFRQGPAILLAPPVARRLNVNLGDRVRLDALHGPVDFYVAGIGDSEFTTCVLDLSDGIAYFGLNEVNAVEIQIRPDAGAEAVRQALLETVLTHGGTLLSLGQAVGQLREIFRQARLSISLLIGITGLVAGLGVVNAMLASVAARRREIGLLRAAGATRSQISRLILIEAAIQGTMAALIGTALGWAVTLLFLSLARTTVGGPVTAPWPAWLPLLGATAIGLVLWPLLAMLGGLAPALHAARLPVIEALYET